MAASSRPSPWLKPGKSPRSPRLVGGLLIALLASGTVTLLIGSRPRPVQAAAHLQPQLSLRLPPRSARLAWGPVVVSANPSPSSGPIALSPDDRFAWMVDPEGNAVSAVKVWNDADQLVRRLPVGHDPAAIAASPTNDLLFVTDSADGALAVIIQPPGDPAHAQVLGALKVGAEPAGVLVTPDGRKVYVANSNSGDVTVIAIERRQIAVVGIIPDVGYQPTGLAFANRHLYVSQFLGQLRDNGRPIDKNEGADDGREGRITVINTATDKVEQTIVLNPLSPAQVGFKSNGSTLDRIPQRKDGSGNEIFDFDTGCFPNLLGSAGIKNGRAYVPAVGSSPNGPFRFNVNLQSVLSVVNLAAGSEETGKTINMNKGIGAE